MKTIFASCLLAVATLSSYADEAEQTYVLASKNPPLPVGLTYRITERDVTSNGKMKMTVGERVMNGELSGTHKEEQIYEFLTKDSVKVTYKEDRKIEKNTLKGGDEPEETIDPIEGRVVLLTRKDGKWSAKLEGEAPELVDQKKVNKRLSKLAKRLNNKIEEDAKTYGLEPRKIGDQWEVDPKIIPGMDEMEIQDGKMKMTFVEVKQFNGELCAVLKGDVKISAKLTEENVEGLDTKMSGEVRFVRSLKYFRDYKMDSKIEMSLEGVMEPQPGVAVNVEMTSDMRGKKAAVIVAGDKE